jgi:hypothetical protein
MRLLHIVVASKACLMLGTSAILSKFLGVWRFVWSLNMSQGIGSSVFSTDYL